MEMVCGRVKMPSENDMALFAARKFCLFLPSDEDCVRQYLKLPLFLYLITLYVGFRMQVN